MVKKLHAFISLISFSLCITILFIFSLLHVKFYHIFYFLSLYMQFYTILELWQNLKLYVRLTLALQLAKIIKTKSHWFQWESHFSFLLQTQIHLLLYIHSTYFIRYTLLVRLWTLFCCQNCLNSLWHSFNKGLETFLRYSGLYPHSSITAPDTNLLFHYIPKGILNNSGDCGGFWADWTHRNLQETSLGWSELCGMV